MTAPARRSATAWENCCDQVQEMSITSRSIMKKNRPAYQLDVICDDTTRETLENIIFAETTTIGIRRCRMERTVMKREFATIATEYGDATVKICRHGEIEKIYSEYESAAVIAEKSGMPVGEAGAWIVQKYKEGNKKA